MGYSKWWIYNVAFSNKFKSFTLLIPVETRDCLFACLLYCVVLINGGHLICTFGLETNTFFASLMIVRTHFSPLSWLCELSLMIVWTISKDCVNYISNDCVNYLSWLCELSLITVWTVSHDCVNYLSWLCELSLMIVWTISIDCVNYISNDCVN